MTENKKDVLDVLNKKFKINLNGEWEIFETSLEAIREDIGDLTIEEIRKIKALLKTKLNSI